MRVEIRVRRRVGNYIPHLDAIGLQRLISPGCQRVALHHLRASRVSGNHYLAQGRVAFTVIETLKDLVQRRVRTERRRACGRCTAHPVIGVPAQCVGRQAMASSVAFIQKLRSDDQGCG